MFIKPLLHVKHDCNIQYVKQHDNLQKFPNAASITSSVGLDKTVAACIFLQQQQNLGRRFGASKMHLSPPVAWAAVRSKAVILLLLTLCLLLLPLWESVIVLCFVLCVTLCPF